MLPRCCWFRCPGGTLFSSSPPPQRRAVSSVALGGSTSTRPRSGREGWRVLAVSLAFFTTTSTSAVCPRARRTRGLASVGHDRPLAARVYFPPRSALLRPTRAFSPPHTIFAS